VIEGILSLLIILGAFILLQRRLHWEIQAVFLLLTRRQDLAIVLFSLLFLPGVFIHEVSHYLMARLLGVRTGRLSIVPRPMEDGRLQLGYLETGRADFVRDALIGAAPLLFGGVIIGFIALFPLRVPDIWNGFASGSPEAVMQGPAFFFSKADFWLWFYLAFAISSTMIPSRSDRRGWLPVSLLIATILVVGISIGAGSWLFQHASSTMGRLLVGITFIFGTGLAVHLILLIPMIFLRSLISRVTGYKVG